ncbi:MAG: bacteriohemerythrin [Pseudomonadota bacterium]
MPLIAWSNELSVGIDSIDAQHQKLINMINALNDALADGSSQPMLQKIFDGLAIYTVKHFAYEENLFATHGYTESVAHKVEHKALLDKVLELKEKMQEGDFMIGIELMAFLKEWLTNHILKTDMAYAIELIAKGAK